MTTEDIHITKLRSALASSDRHRRASAAVELGHRGDQQSLEALKVLAQDADDLVGVAGMFACWMLGYDAVSGERMVAALASADEEVVQETVQAVCQIGDAMVPRLQSLLQAGSPYTHQILQILGDIGGTKSLEIVSKFVSDDPELTEIAKDVLQDLQEEMASGSDD